MSSTTVFVCGATGIQGGTIARHLLAQSAKVHFMVRGEPSEASEELTALGATAFPGHYDDAASLSAAMAGCTAVFLNFMPSFTDPGQEVRHARAVVSAARAAGIDRALCSSLLGLEEMPRRNQFPPGSMVAEIFDGKIETRAVVTQGFPVWTVLRPAKFMVDFLAPRARGMFPGLAEDGVWTTPLRRHDKVAVVDTDTVGSFGAAALLGRPDDRMAGQDVDLFDEVLTPEEIVGRLSKASGREITVTFLSDEEVAARKEDIFLTAQVMMRDMEEYADFAKVKKWDLPLSSFEKFLQRENKRVVESFGPAS